MNSILTEALYYYKKFIYLIVYIFHFYFGISIFKQREKIILAKHVETNSDITAEVNFFFNYSFVKTQKYLRELLIYRKKPFIEKIFIIIKSDNVEFLELDMASDEYKIWRYNNSQMNMRMISVPFGDELSFRIFR